MPSSPIAPAHKRARSVDTGKATQQQPGPPVKLSKSRSVENLAATDMREGGGNEGKRDQRSDTPDQSAARGTTLELMFRRAKKTGKGKSRWKERRKRGWRWKSGPVCGQKDQAQHPKGTRNRERAGTRGTEREQTTRTRKRTETRERKQQTQTKRGDRSTTKQKRDPKSRSTKVLREERRETRKKRWSQK